VNIFLYSSLGTGLITPFIILTVLAALLIAVLVAYEKAESLSGNNVTLGQYLFNQETHQRTNPIASSTTSTEANQSISKRITTNPGQWGSYEKAKTRPAHARISMRRMLCNYVETK
jgi:divalent metal cation (Fe/Co/Zn/Cd) transporter